SGDAQSPALLASDLKNKAFNRMDKLPCQAHYEHTWTPGRPPAGVSPARTITAHTGLHPVS
ncbi:hypothetical protein DKX15_22925, partial [Enterococcus faecium]